MFGIIKIIFIVLSTSIVNASNHTKCLSLSNQRCMIELTFINLSPAVKLDRCFGSCNTLNDLSNNVCVPNKTEALNLGIVNIITGVNESNINFFSINDVTFSR